MDDERTEITWQDVELAMIYCAVFLLLATVLTVAAASMEAL